MSAPTPSRPLVMIPLRLLLAAAVGGLGFLAVWKWHALWYGDDLHPVRVAGVVAPLFLAGLVVGWPGRGPLVRVAALVLGGGLGVAAWWEIPSPAGRTLRDALAERDELKDQIARNNPEQSGIVRDLQDRGRALAADYPSVGAEVDQAANDWAMRSVNLTWAWYSLLPPERAADITRVREQTRRLAEVAPPIAQLMARPDREWGERAVRKLSAILAEIPPGDAVQFNEGAATRHTVAELFPATRQPLIDAENAWADRTAAALPPTSDAKKIQEACRACRDALRAASGLDRDPARFRAARTAVLDMAFAAAKAEARDRRPRTDEAFGVARTFAVEWFEEATDLGRESDLASFREEYRALAEQAGPPTDIAPPPRPKP